jgi:hypothetical protein
MEAMVKRRKIFISHKSIDHDLAIRFKDELVGLGLKDHEVFLAEEIHPGAEWSADILKALSDSHTLLLLYTDPSHDWDWCLFECGFFAGKQVTDEKRYQLICVNSGNARTAPLQMWQDVSSRDALEGVLKQYCEGDEYFKGVNPDAARRGVSDKTAQELWNEFLQRKPATTPSQWAETLKRRRLMIYITTDAMKTNDVGWSGAHASHAVADRWRRVSAPVSCFRARC